MLLKVHYRKAVALYERGTTGLPNDVEQCSGFRFVRGLYESAQRRMEVVWRVGAVPDRPSSSRSKPVVRIVCRAICIHHKVTGALVLFPASVAAGCCRRGVSDFVLAYGAKNARELLC